MGAIAIIAIVLSYGALIEFAPGLLMADAVASADMAIALPALAEMAAVSFAATFVVTLATGGTLQQALIGGLLAAATTFVSMGGLQALGNSGGAIGEFMKSIDGALSTIKEALKSISGVFDEIGKAMFGGVGPTPLSVGDSAASSAHQWGKFTTSMVQKAVKDVIGIAVSHQMGEKGGKNIGFLSGLVTSLVTSVAFAALGMGSVTMRSLMAGVARVAVGSAIDRALGPKAAWLSVFFMSFLTFNDEETKKVKGVDGKEYVFAQDFFEATPLKMGGGLISALGAKLLERITASMREDMYIPGSNGQLSAAGHLVRISVTGFFDSMANKMNERMEDQSGYVPPEMRRQDLTLVNQALELGQLTKDQANLLLSMNQGSLHELIANVGLKFESLGQMTKDGDRNIVGEVQFENIANEQTKEILSAAGKGVGDVIQFRVNDRTGEVFFKVGFEQARLAGFVQALVQDKDKANSIVNAFGKLGKDATFDCEFTINKGLGGNLDGSVNFNKITDKDLQAGIGKLGFEGDDVVKISLDLRTTQFTCESKVIFKSVDALEKTGVEMKESAKAKLKNLEAAGAALGVKANLTGLITGNGSNGMNADAYRFQGADSARLDKSILPSGAGKTLSILDGIGTSTVSGEANADGTITDTRLEVQTGLAAVVERVNAQKGADLEGTPLEALARTNLDLPPDSVRKIEFRFLMRDDGVPVQITTLEVWADKVAPTTREKLTAAGITPVKEDGLPVFKFELVTNSIDGTHVYQTGGSEKAAKNPLDGTGIAGEMTIQGKKVAIQLGHRGADGSRPVLSESTVNVSGELKTSSGQVLLSVDGSASLTPTRVVETKTGVYEITEFTIKTGQSTGPLGVQFGEDSTHYRSGEIRVSLGAVVSVSI